MIERITDEVLEDDYFNNLFEKANRLLAGTVFSENGTRVFLEPKELQDLLRFSDLLSNSKKPEARNKAYAIVTVLNDNYNSNPYYKTFAHSVLAKLGNFPGIEYLKNNNDNNAELPFERNIEKILKEFIQTVPDTEGLIFTDSQFELYTKISGAKSFSFSGPTSMGKSFIIKSFIRKAISNKPPENIAILVPTRALINQFSIDLNKELKIILEHYKYKVVTNSNVAEISSPDDPHYVLVLTPERLLSYLSQPNNPPLAYLFVDEAHKLASVKDSRSITAYTAISRALKQNPSLNLYFASPNVSNPEVFLRLFHRDEKLSYKTSETPVSQNLFFIDLVQKKVTHYTGNTNYQFEPELVKKASSIYDILIGIGEGDNNIVYCSSRLSAVEKSLALYEHNSRSQIDVSKNVKRVITQVKAYIHKDYYLADFLASGIAYHFGNLPQIIRNKVEALFKEREIGYIFCTSTLLEGVNLPAKNVFILNNKNGSTSFQPIDFWNLAGRAGRLKYELSGNIFCLKESEKEWKKHETLLEKTPDIILNPSVESYIDNSKQFKLIESYINENISKIKEPEYIKEILAYIANIISIDVLDNDQTNYKSELLKKLISENKNEILELAKRKNGVIDIPLIVLNTNHSINLKLQNELFKTLKNKATDPASIKLPSNIDYEACKSWLLYFFDAYKWNTDELKMFSSKDEAKRRNQLSYYALLMNKWINGIHLSQIINESINWSFEKQSTINVGYVDGKPQYQTFNKSKHHINILIGEIIEDIEKIIRFKLEKYFNNYYMMVVALLGEENAGVNWATFLEYGTKNSIIIALQNYGLSRHSADFIYRNHRDCLKVEADKLVEIHLARLKQKMNRDDIEYDEISSLLF